MADPIGTTLSVDISEVRANLKVANNLIKENESQWLVAASAMDDWTQSEAGLNRRLEALSKNIKEQEKNVAYLVEEKEKAIKQYGAESVEVNQLNALIKTHTGNLMKSRKEYKQVSGSLDKLQKSNEDVNEELKDTSKDSKKAEKALDKLEDSAKDAGDGFTVAKGAIASFIGTGLSSLVSGIGSAVSSMFNLTESTLEYRRELARVTTVADQVGVAGDRIIDKWIDMNAVIQDESSVTEGLNNLMTAGFTAEKELDSITKVLEGASIQWAETLKFEGLSDSLQEWIGSDGVNLTGQFAELLERLGYNLEDVTEETKGMTDAQRRNWAVMTLNKAGLDDVSEAYRTANKDMVEYNKANAELLQAQANLGESMQPFVTMIKNSTADIIYSFTDMVNGVDGAGEQLLYNIGYMAGQIYNTVKNLISTIMPVVSSLFPQIINLVIENLPSMITQGVNIISSMITGLSNTIPQVVPKINEMINSILSTISQNLPTLLNSALELFGQIVLALPQTLVNLETQLPTIITTIIDGLLNGENSVLDTALKLLFKIVEAIPPLVVDLLANLPQIIESITGSLEEAIPNVFEGAKALFWKIIDAIPDIVVGLIENLPQILLTVLNFFGSVSGDILSGAIDLLWNIILAIPEIVVEIGKKMPDIINGIINGLLAGTAGIFKTGYDLIAGLIDGIFSFDIVTAMKSLGSSILGGIKKFFGIKSPSKVMREEVGKYLTEGLAIGMKDGEYYIADSAEELAKHGIEEVTDSFKDIEEAGKETSNSFADGFMDGINGTKREISKAVENTVTEASKDVDVTPVSETGKKVVEELADGIKDYSSEVETALTSLFEGDYSDLADSAINAIAKTSTIGSIVSGVLSFVKNAITNSDEEFKGSMNELAENLIDGIMNGFNSVVDNLPSILKGAVEFIKAFALALIKAIPEIVKRLPEIISIMVETLISDGIPALFEVGMELVKGLIEGMFSINLWDVIKSVGNGIVNGFKKLFGIKSPSRVMADEIGKNLALGIADGITDNISGVNEALKSGVDTSLQMDGIQRKYVTVNQTNNYAQAHSRYELYKSKHDTASAVKLALQGV